MSHKEKKGGRAGNANIIDIVILIALLGFAIAVAPAAIRLRSLEFPSPAWFRADNPVTEKTVETPAPQPQVSGKPQEDLSVALKHLPHKHISLEVRFSGYSAEVAGAMSAGDTDEEFPSTRIKKIRSVVPMIGVNARGLHYHDPYLKSITVSLSAKVAFRGEELFYRGEPLKIGWHFLLKTARYNVNGEVIAIDEH